VVFTPQIRAYDRGIVSTIHVEIAKGWDMVDVTATLAEPTRTSPSFALPAGRLAFRADGPRTNFCESRGPWTRPTPPDRVEPWTIV